MKHGNQPVMNAAQNMMLKMAKKDSVVEKADLIMKKDLGNTELMREKENRKIQSKQ